MLPSAAVARDYLHPMATEGRLQAASRRARGPLRVPGPAWIALGVLVLIAGGFAFYEGRGETFWLDEWTWIVDRRDSSLDSFLAPHNDHLSLVPVTIYKILFATVGVGHYAPYRALAVALHLTCVVLVFAYAWRRVGALPALWAAALLAFLGPGWQNIMWGFQIGWTISLAAGVAALLLLDREDRTGDIGACAAVAVALASSGVGLAIALGVTAELLWRRRPVRDLWIVAVPLVPYAVWWLAYRPGGHSENIDLVTRFVADSAAGALGGLSGLVRPALPELDALTWGRPLAAVAAVALAWRLTRYVRVPPRVVGLLTTLLAFWVLTALRRATVQPPDASRYVYVGALFVLLIAAELARGRRAPRGTLAVASVLVFAAVVSNAGWLGDAGGYLREQAAFTRADLAALDITAGNAGPGYIARLPGYPFLQVDAARYRQAAADIGTPAYTVAELQTAQDPARRVADAELVRADRLELRPTAAGAAPAGGACRTLSPPAVRSAAGTPAIEVTVPPAGIAIKTTRGEARVQARRFATGWSDLPRDDTVGPSATAVLQPRRDRSSQPWRVRVSAQDRVSVCGLR
jgi:hypothetical protein